MKIVILFFCSLALISGQFMKKQDSLFAELDQQHLSNALLSAISLHMSTNSPLSDILALIEQVRTLLSEEQQTEDEEIESIRADCNEMITSFNQAIKFHADTIESVQNALDSNNDLSIVIQQNLKDIEERLATIEEMTGEENERREKEAELHGKKLEEIDEAIQTVDEAFSLVEHLKTGNSFIQLQGSFRRVNEKLEKHKSKNALMVPLISVLSQIAMKADQSAVSEILTLLGRIREDYTGEKTDEIEGEERAIQAHDHYIKELAEEKTKILNKRTQLYQTASETKEAIADSQRSLEFHNKELNKNQEGNERKKEYCRVKNDEYEKTTEYRKMDRKAVDMLMAKCKEKANALKEYLKGREQVEF